MPERLMSAIEEIHLIELEQGWDDDVKCEFGHETTTCMTNVVARLVSTHTSVLLCETAAQYQLALINDPHELCKKCKLPCGICWKVLPA